MISGAIQGKYILGSITKVGDPRRKHEDRVFKGEIFRRGGEPLIVGIVADGVGSADFGERGAQLAIDTVIRKLTESQGENIPELLEHAIESANKAVFDENQKVEGDGLTTLLVAAIYNDHCYIGNVGDSRAYWIQGGNKGKMLQLTRDHNFGNIYGGVDPASEEGGVLVNAIGKKEEIFVDLGFYLKGKDEEQAYKLGVNGLPIKAGDSIMLCSDGLIKLSPARERYATDEEIRASLQTEHETDTAAIKMVSAALGRRPDDNVSAVTIQYLSEEKVLEIIANKRREGTTKLIRQTMPVIGILAGVVIVIALVSALNRYVNPPLQILPTYTPYPTLASPNNIFVAGQSEVIGQLTSPQGQSQSLANGIFTITDGTRLEVDQNSANIGLSDGSSLYLSQGTIFVFSKLQEGIELTLERGSIMVRLNGSTPVIIKTSDGFNAQVSGSIMGFQLSQDPFGIFVDCFEGHCAISGGNIPLSTLGEQFTRYIFYAAGSANSYNQVYERCKYWEGALGQDTILSLIGNLCLPPPTPTDTPKPRNNVPLATPGK